MAKRRELAARTFEVPGLVTLPSWVAGLGETGIEGVASADVGPRMLLRATYLDTPELRLTRDGVTLRHQGGAGVAHWHCRISGLADPAELTVAGPVTKVPEPIADVLIPWLRGGELEPVAAVRTERVVTVLRDAAGTPLAELVDDSVAVLEGRRVAVKHRELTLLPRAVGDADTTPPTATPVDLVALLHAVGARLIEAGAVEAALVPAVTRGLGPRVHEVSDIPPPISLAATSPARDVVAHSLRTGLRKLLQADTAVRLDRADGVHQMRVSCRRLRSDLGTFASLIDATWSEKLRAETRWLAGELGAARDLEVLRERLGASAEQDCLLPLDGAALLRLDAIFAERADVAQKRVLATVRSQRYLRLLNDLVGAAAQPRTTPLAEGPADEVLPPLVGAAWQRLERRAGRLKSRDPDDTWHEARITAKRARYAAEAVVPALGKRAAATAAAAAAVQEVLGEHQDGATAAAVLLEAASEHPGDGAFSFVLGRLAERQRASVVAARRSFPAVWRTTAVGKVARWTRVT